MLKFILAHPYHVSALVTLVLKNVFNALISSIPAPTKDSTASEIYWFKVANRLAGNWKRANSTALEDSPNFQAAVDRYIARLAEKKTWQPNSGDNT